MPIPRFAWISPIKSCETLATVQQFWTPAFYARAACAAGGKSYSPSAVDATPIPEILWPHTPLRVRTCSLGGSSGFDDSLLPTWSLGSPMLNDFLGSPGLLNDPVPGGGAVRTVSFGPTDSRSMESFEGGTALEGFAHSPASKKSADSDSDSNDENPETKMSAGGISADRHMSRPPDSDEDDIND